MLPTFFDLRQLRHSKVQELHCYSAVRENAEACEIEPCKVAHR